MRGGDVGVGPQPALPGVAAVDREDGIGRVGAGLERAAAR